MHHYWDTVTQTTILFQSKEWNPEAEKKKNYLNIFFKSKERFPVLILFQLLIYPIIAPSFVIIDFKISRRAAHLFICLSLKCLQREGQRRKGGCLLASAASKLRGNLRAKCLQREDTNTHILLTEKICPAYEHQRTKICAPRSFTASELPSVPTMSPDSQFYSLLPKIRSFLVEFNEPNPGATLLGPEIAVALRRIYVLICSFQRPLRLLSTPSTKSCDTRIVIAVKITFTLITWNWLYIIHINSLREMPR